MSLVLRSEDLKQLWNSKINLKKDWKRSGEFLICELCRSDPYDPPYTILTQLPKARPLPEKRMSQQSCCVASLSDFLSMSDLPDITRILALIFDILQHNFYIYLQKAPLCNWTTLAGRFGYSQGSFPLGQNVFQSHLDWVFKPNRHLSFVLPRLLAENLVSVSICDCFTIASPLFHSTCLVAVSQLKKALANCQTACLLRPCCQLCRSDPFACVFFVQWGEAEGHMWPVPSVVFCR